MALAYATSDIGAHHTRAWTIAREIELGLNEQHYERFYSSVTGQPTTLSQLLDLYYQKRGWDSDGIPAAGLEKHFSP